MRQVQGQEDCVQQLVGRQITTLLALIKISDNSFNLNLLELFEPSQMPENDFT